MEEKEKKKKLLYITKVFKVIYKQSRKLHPVTCQLLVKMKHCQYKLNLTSHFVLTKGKGESIKRRGKKDWEIAKTFKTYEFLTGLRDSR